MPTDLSLDGSSLTADLLAAASEGPVVVRCDPAALARVRASWECATAIVATRTVYGRTTGVGANRTTAVEPGLDSDLRMLRSHATGHGDLLPAQTVRAGMLVRLNQILRGGSGLHPDVVTALVRALALESVPVIHERGAIGTGDLSALGELALALMGELAFTDGSTHRLWSPHPGDALPILSSNAFTAASAALALVRSRELAGHEENVMALSLIAMRGGTEAFAAAVARARPHHGVVPLLERQRALLSASAHTPARVQDSYGLRTFPQVAAALRAAIDRLESTLAVELNSAPENPLIDPDEGDCFHNGNFHASALAQALDGVKIALYSDAALGLSRLTDLSTPEMTGLAPFLGDGPAGSSGVMLLEYNAAAALASLRHHAAPATLGSVVISRGVENHSSFATQAAQQLHVCLDRAADVLACEAVAAHRALTMRDSRPAADSPLARFDAAMAERCDPRLEDRSLTTDLARVRELFDLPIPLTRK